MLGAVRIAKFCSWSTAAAKPLRSNPII